jgi:hypothetical protein
MQPESSATASSQLRSASADGSRNHLLAHAPPAALFLQESRDGIQIVWAGGKFRPWALGHTDAEQHVDPTTRTVARERAEANSGWSAIGTCRYTPATISTLEPKINPHHKGLAGVEHARGHDLDYTPVVLASRRIGPALLG